MCSASRGLLKFGKIRRKRSRSGPNRVVFVRSTHRRRIAFFAGNVVRLVEKFYCARVSARSGGKCAWAGHHCAGVWVRCEGVRIGNQCGVVLRFFFFSSWQQQVDSVSSVRLWGWPVAWAGREAQRDSIKASFDNGWHFFLLSISVCLWFVCRVRQVFFRANGCRMKSQISAIGRNSYSREKKAIEHGCPLTEFQLECVSLRFEFVWNQVHVQEQQKTERTHSAERQLQLLGWLFFFCSFVFLSVVILFFFSLPHYHKKSPVPRWRKIEAAAAAVS